MHASALSAKKTQREHSYSKSSEPIMLDTSQLSAWLRESGDSQAASIVDQCSLNYIYVTTLVDLSGDNEIELVDVHVEAPAKILRDESPEAKKNAEIIERALAEIAPSLGCYFRNIYWVPRVPMQRSQAEAEITERLSIVDSDHVRDAWKKALERKNADPDGALTAARTLLESVLKHVLDKADETYTNSMNLPALYSAAAKTLEFAPSQQTDTMLKGVLGNCQAVVNGLANMRNHLGDAHGKGEAGEKPDALLAELAVNLAGAISLFIVRKAEMA
jgi:hypothetical protein